MKKDENGSILYDDDFFGKQTSLTVSGQLEGELAATALGQIYTFGPTFRAENSNTPRHLAEFWMIEPEVAFNDINDNMDLAEDFLKYLIRYALEHCHVRYVDVNEQNKKASGFYGHFGFRVIGRDAKDASGEPYPILHLKLRGIMKIENWGLVPYSEAWKRQTELFNAVVEAKQVGKTYENRIIFVEHPHVYTLGKSGKETNMLLGEAQLKMIGATLYHIDRGGDITYHGPGQLVCYPILNLEDYHLGLKEYIYVLEEAVIRVCASYGIEAGRVKGATGVWLAAGTPQERKICAIGVRSSHFVTMHGLALNVNTDLRYFSYIHPCGFMDKGVTSLQKELGCEVPMEKVAGRLQNELSELL